MTQQNADDQAARIAELEAENAKLAAHARDAEAWLAYYAAFTTATVAAEQAGHDPATVAAIRARATAKAHRPGLTGFALDLGDESESAWVERLAREVEAEGGPAGGGVTDDRSDTPRVLRDPDPETFGRHADAIAAGTVRVELSRAPELAGEDPLEFGHRVHRGEV
jgi:hypothetical protein